MNLQLEDDEHDLLIVIAAEHYYRLALINQSNEYQIRRLTWRTLRKLLATRPRYTQNARVQKLN